MERTRLLTLTGPGGTGKTRLGLQAAAEASERYPDGVFWVPLAPLRDPALVLDAAGQAVGASDGLADYVADKALLLLLDNFEHLVDASAGLAGLLGECPNLHVLVTSRELLRVPGEQAYPVPPLEPGDGEELFLARAVAVRPDFATSPAVREVCARLENLPLALELAAARVRVLSPEQLLERLSHRLDLLKAGRGVDPRQQTLRATIEWSHELLEPEPQRLFARLAVFRGGWTLAAAEQVCDAELDTLESLVDKSLVRVRGEGRFWMLETIREYAVERLEASGEADNVRRRHAEHFLDLAEEAEPHLRRDEVEWADRLEDEHDNLRAALDRLDAAGDTQDALRLAGAVSRFWYVRSHLLEGRRRLEHALGADPAPTAARGRALNGMSVMAMNLGDAAAAKDLAVEALALHREFGDEWGTAYSAFMVANATAECAELAAARPLLEESIRLFDELGDEKFALISLFNLGWITGDLGDPAREREIHREVLERARAAGDERMEAAALAQLGVNERADGRFAEAEALLREAIRIERRRGDLLSVSLDIGRLASVFAHAGRLEEAARLLAASEAMMERLGVDVYYWARERNDEARNAIRAGLDEAAFAQATDEGRALDADRAIELALGGLG